MPKRRKYGARAALFGRKINSAECQLAFVEFLRRIVDGDVSPEEAVRAYHGVLGKLNIKPHRTLADDMELQSGVMSYGGSATVRVAADVKKLPSGKPAGDAAKHDCGCGGHDPKKCECKTGPAAAAGKPDFAHMTAAEKLAYNKAKRDRIFG